MPSPSIDPIDDGRKETRSARESGDHFGSVFSTSTEDLAAQDAGYDADVEIVKPYAIEEPDDETDQTPTSAPTPNMPDAADNWQKELVNSLRGLYCDSDSNDAHAHAHSLTRTKRGRKRKPDISMTSSQSFQSLHGQAIKDRDFESRVGSAVLSPKRRRRKSAHAGLASDETSTTGSSPVVFSSPHNSNRPNTPRRNSAFDKMDVD